MLTTVLDHIREADVNASLVAGDPGAPAGVIEIVADGEPALRLALEERTRAPETGEVRELGELHRLLAPYGLPLLVAPYISPPLGVALIKAGWSWADNQGNYDIRGPRLRLRQRRTYYPPKPSRQSLPRGAGSWAIVRTLIACGDDREQTKTTILATKAGVSQPRASQVLGQLAELNLVEKIAHAEWSVDRPALLDRFLDEYGGPGGSERYFSTRGPVAQAAGALARRVEPERLALSADVGSETLAPCRSPTIVIAYLATEVAFAQLRLSRLGLVEAQGRGDANVIIREPVDPSIFPTPPLIADRDGLDLRLADPVQMIWDLEDWGGAERFEAARALRGWLLG